MSRFLDVAAAVAGDVRTRADELNRLDGIAGDGDLGVTMTLAATAIAGAVPELSGQPLAATLAQLGARVAREAPSTSGTLVATALLRAGRAAADAAPETGAAPLFDLLLAAALRGISERGKAEPGSKTMVDALTPAAAAATAAVADGADVAATVRAAAEAADRGARETASMTPRFGRAGWLAERSAGHEDAGARLIAIILESAAGRLTDARPAGTEPA
jgi:dihydroxyacetone kinase